MKLSKKTIISIGLIILLLTSGIVAWTQFFDKKEIVIFETTKGILEIELDRGHAPITVANFFTYVKDGYYDGTIIHRVEAGFVIQGGGYTIDGAAKTTKDPIILESNNGLKNLKGTIAMARTNIPNSATSQFFINLEDNSGLDYKSSSSPGYAVFGRVISGMDVIDKIAGVKVETRGAFQNWPVEDIIITKAYLKP